MCGRLACRTPFFSGTPKGTLKCVNGAYVSTLTGCVLAPTTSISCPPFSPYGYTSSCLTSTTSLPSGTSCTNIKCASGFTGKPAGSLACFNGNYAGSLSGCTPISGASICYPFTPNGYLTSCSGAPYVPPGVVCGSTSCAPGYYGTKPAGKLTCDNGVEGGVHAHVY